MTLKEEVKPRITRMGTIRRLGGRSIDCQRQPEGQDERERTRQMMNKATLARPVPGLAAFLQAHFQASLKMVCQNLRSIRFANDQHWPDASRSSISQILSTIGCMAASAGPLAERERRWGFGIPRKLACEGI